MARSWETLYVANSAAREPLERARDWCKRRDRESLIRQARQAAQKAELEKWLQRRSELRALVLAR